MGKPLFSPGMADMFPIRLVDNYYVEEVELDKIIDGAMHGLLEELDPHSTYIPAQEFELENGEKQSNAITLARHIRKKDIEVPIIVFAGKKHAPENRDRALKFGAFDYVYEWHDLFSRIEDLFKDPVKDH